MAVSSPPFYTKYVHLPKASEITPSSILNNPKFFPFFQNALGGMDGTHINCCPSAAEWDGCQNRKGGLTELPGMLFFWFALSLPGEWLGKDQLQMVPCFQTLVSWIWLFPMESFTLLMQGLEHVIHCLCPIVEFTIILLSGVRQIFSKLIFLQLLHRCLTVFCNIVPKTMKNFSIYAMHKPVMWLNISYLWHHQEVLGYSQSSTLIWHVCLGMNPSCLWFTS